MNKRTIKSISLALIVSSVIGLVVGGWLKLPSIYDIGLCLVLTAGMILHPGDD